MSFLPCRSCPAEPELIRSCCHMQSVHRRFDLAPVKAGGAGPCLGAGQELWLGIWAGQGGAVPFIFVDQFHLPGKIDVFLRELCLCRSVWNNIANVPWGWAR